MDNDNWKSTKTVSYPEKSLDKIKKRIGKQNYVKIGAIDCCWWDINM